MKGPLVSVNVTKTQLNYISSNMAVCLVLIYNKLFLNNNNKDMLCARICKHPPIPCKYCQVHLCQFSDLQIKPYGDMSVCLSAGSQNKRTDNALFSLQLTNKSKKKLKDFNQHFSQLGFILCKRVLIELIGGLQITEEWTHIQTLSVLFVSFVFCVCTSLSFDSMCFKEESKLLWALPFIKKTFIYNIFLVFYLSSNLIFSSALNIIFHLLCLTTSVFVFMILLLNITLFLLFTFSFPLKHFVTLLKSKLHLLIL